MVELVDTSRCNIGIRSNVPSTNASTVKLGLFYVCTLSVVVIFNHKEHSVIHGVPQSRHINFNNSVKHCENNSLHSVVVFLMSPVKKFYHLRDLIFF